jgi:hypothetical protein
MLCLPLAAAGQFAALAYARAHFPPFQHTHMQQIQRLMGALCFARRGAGAGGAPSAKPALLPTSGPYADLFQLEDQWAALARDFVRQSCALLGQVRGTAGVCICALHPRCRWLALKCVAGV